MLAVGLDSEVSASDAHLLPEVGRFCSAFQNNLDNSFSRPSGPFPPWRSSPLVFPPAHGMAQGFSILVADLHNGLPQLSPGLNRLTHSRLVFTGHIEGGRSSIRGSEGEVQVGHVSPGWVLVAGTGRIAAGARGLGKSPLDSRRCQPVEFGEKGLSIHTHYIMSKQHIQPLPVKHKNEKITVGSIDQK